MNIELSNCMKCHTKSYLEIMFYKSSGKTDSQIVSIVGCSMTAAFDVCKNFFKSRTE